MLASGGVSPAVALPELPTDVDPPDDEHPATSAIADAAARITHVALVRRSSYVLLLLVGDGAAPGPGWPLISNSCSARQAALTLVPRVPTASAAAVSRFWRTTVRLPPSASPMTYLVAIPR